MAQKPTFDKRYICFVFTTDFFVFWLLYPYALVYENGCTNNVIIKMFCHKCSTRQKQLSIQACYNQGRTKGELWLKTPFSLIFYKTFIICANEINYFRILFACLFVDSMQIPRNKFACKIQGTL